MQHSAKFRLGMVGGGLNSAVGYAHFVASRIDGLWDLQAGAFSRHAQWNEKSAAVYGVGQDRTYRSVEEMLDAESGRLDAIVILTPSPSHADLVLQCLQRGLPVICEKSLAMNTGEVAGIQDECSGGNRFLAVIYNYSGYPMVRELRGMIREGVLGELLHFQAEMPQEGFLRTDSEGNRPRLQEWRTKDGVVPTLHLDLAVHLHELVHYLTGQRPLEVVADQASRGLFPVIDNVVCLARYTNAMQGHLWFSKSALGHRNGLRLRLFGTKASAEWYQANPEELSVSFADGRRQVLDRAAHSNVASLARYNRFKAGHPAGFNEALANLYVDIHQSLTHFKETGRQESDEIYGVHLAAEGLAFLEAMSRSCATRQWEAVK